jgi:hypothetical protein
MNARLRNACMQGVRYDGAAASGVRRSLRSTAAAGLHAEVFYNYPFPSQPDQIPRSLMPDFVTSAPNINYAEHHSDNVGIQLLAKTNVSFAVRFSGSNPNLALRSKSQLCRDYARVCEAGLTVLDWICVIPRQSFASEPGNANTELVSEEAVTGCTPYAVPIPVTSTASGMASACCQAQGSCWHGHSCSS